MDILVRHNGTNITSSVISYEREGNICTGVGTLVIVIARTIDRDFDPWDTIDIHEEGDFRVRYYISSVQDSIPEGTITLECQDKSKKIVDYFIPDVYMIDYPSYTRYWIEKFLDEVDVAYEFTTSSQGNLISNNTQLGMTSAYEQLLVLLQMSGWYMYFDGNGKAIIGTLETNLASSGGSIGKTDILNINVVSDDKMLRNRALVLGAYDPYSLSYATADVTVKTPWNYDSRDVRAMVVSNSNIPNASSAYGIANQLIKEFSRITVEKHITVHGARNFNLGDALRVDSNVWRGKGLITTFGVRMSKEGLVTDVVLDQRCPRLFGFFNFGDYVYVGTFGDGVWRKHIKFLHTWENFSTGLTNLNITDLHINNGVFGAVGASGEMYRALYELPWHPITITGLMSSVDTTVASGAGNMSMFSGIMGRATIVDKVTNNLKFGVDNRTYINHGDYFLSLSGWYGFLPFSGMISSGVTTSRGWIVEYDPYTGQLVGGLGSGIYPIHYSGSYDISVIDLENDGKHDYVSVKAGGVALENLDGDYNLGRRTNQPFGSTDDQDAYAVFPTTSGYIDSTTSDFGVADINALICVDNGISGTRAIVHEDYVAGVTNSHVMRERRYTREWDEEELNWGISSSLVTSDATLSTQKIKAIYPSGVVGRSYDLYYFKPDITDSFITRWYKRTWNAQTNLYGSETLVATVDMSKTTRNILNTGGGGIDRQVVVVDDIMYCLHTAHYNSQTFGGQSTQPAYILIVMLKINMLTGGTSENLIYNFVTVRHPDFPAGSYYYLGGITTSPMGPSIGMWATSNGVKIAGWFAADLSHAITPVFFKLARTDYFFSGNDQLITSELVYEDTGDTSDVPVTYLPRLGMTSAVTGQDSRKAKNTTATEGFMVAASSSASDMGNYGICHTGSLVKLLTNQLSTYYHLRFDRIYPLFTTGSNYIAKNDSNEYFLCSASSLEPISQITAPGGFELRRPLSSPSTQYGTSTYYWLMRETVNFDYVIAPAAGGAIYTLNTTKITSNPSMVNRPSVIVGEFIISDILNASVGGASASASEVTYMALSELPSLGRFLVLQREGMEYTVIQEAAYPMRVDISNSSPVLVVGSGQDTFTSNFVFSDSVLQVFPQSTFSGMQVDDYRYTLLEPTTSGFVSSGFALQSTALFVHASGVFGADLNTYSGGFHTILGVPSGWGTRIETSNFGMGGQYIFVTTSGDAVMFFQKDPQAFGFTSYSGLPDSRPTIIRLDDRI